jgi:hypothetical protein
MATLLTSVSTPSGSESCTSLSSGGSGELPLREALAVGRGGSDGSAIGFRTLQLRDRDPPEPGGPLRFALPRLSRLPQPGELVYLL